MEAIRQKPKKEKRPKKCGKGLGIPLAAAILLAASLLGAGLGFGPGGSGGEAAATGPQPQKETAPQTIPTEAPATESAAQEELTRVDVSVVGNDYFYQNKRLSLAQLLERLDALEGAFVVVITDDNASLKAYNALTDALGENKIAYTLQ